MKNLRVSRKVAALITAAVLMLPGCSSKKDEDKLDSSLINGSNTSDSSTIDNSELEGIVLPEIDNLFPNSFLQERRDEFLDKERQIQDVEINEKDIKKMLLEYNIPVEYTSQEVVLEYLQAAHNAEQEGKKTGVFVQTYGGDREKITVNINSGEYYNTLHCDLQIGTGFLSEEINQVIDNGFIYKRGIYVKSNREFEVNVYGSDTILDPDLRSYIYLDHLDIYDDESFEHKDTIYSLALTSYRLGQESGEILNGVIPEEFHNKISKDIKSIAAGNISMEEFALNNETSFSTVFGKGPTEQLVKRYSKLP